MPSGQKQTTTTQTAPNGATTTTVVTTTSTVAPTPVINQATLGSLGIAKAVEKKIEQQKNSQALNGKQPLNELLDKTFAVTFGKDKPVSQNELSFSSTEHISDLPQRVLDILMFHGITFSAGDRIVHTPGALFFSLVQQTETGKKYTTFSFQERIPETTGDNSNIDNNQEDNIETDTDESTMTMVDDVPNVFESTKTDSIPVQTNIQNSNVTVPIGMTIPTAGTLGTIGLVSQPVVDTSSSLSINSSISPADSITTSSASKPVPLVGEISPESWSFEKEIVSGPKPAITLEEKIKEVTTFSSLHDLITAEPVFADESSDDIWALVKNYTHGLIKIDRIPRDFGLQQKVDHLKQVLDSEQQLLELPKQSNIETVTSSVPTLPIFSSVITPTVDANHASVLESLGLTAIAPQKNISETMPIPNPLIISTPLKTEQILPTSLETKKSISRTDVYQIILKQLSNAFAIPMTDTISNNL